MTHKSLSEFSEALLTHIGKPTDLRPFVCDGSPLDCEALIVGHKGIPPNGPRVLAASGC